MNENLGKYRSIGLNWIKSIGSKIGSKSDQLDQTNKIGYRIKIGSIGAEQQDWKSDQNWINRIRSTESDNE